MDDISPREKGYDTALRAARNELQGADIRARCRELGVIYTGNEPVLHFNAFGEELSIDTGSCVIVAKGTMAPADVRVQILVLRYFLCGIPMKPSGRLISFRDIPGGSFYWEPFRGRTIVPLVKRFGNDLQELRRRLMKFTWRDIGTGDLGASIHLIGVVEMFLIYRAGDEEFPPDADILFDESVKRVYSAEDIAVMAGLICGKLMRG
ncbi:MAG TPA: DUF3786 domain-containing protein [Spirochaetota bacterium]|nr:DUF3786 domain-containing protein [Spirochaetota bacterium]HPQ54420.1 DUF3786 domain-containing protein [Spirochaetota bacterium]